MGKMGARELNFSSDIDLIALFDDARFDGDDGARGAGALHPGHAQLVKLISENTEDGYVFRTDLRLRPSPSTTPVCMAVDAAERYYESVGRTWERAAHIKARPLVDDAAGEAYLATLGALHLAAAPRFRGHRGRARHAAQDPRAEGALHRGELPRHDLKLGPGGIREIEFFAQTRQLIMGGREPDLRVPTTLGALDALVAGGWIAAAARDELAEDYARAAHHRAPAADDGGRADTRRAEGAGGAHAARHAGG